MFYFYFHNNSLRRNNEQVSVLPMQQLLERLPNSPFLRGMYVNSFEQLYIYVLCVYFYFCFCLQHRQHDAQEAFMQLLTMLKEESNFLLSEYKATFSEEALQELSDNDLVATTSLLLSTRFNTNYTYYLRCEDDGRRNGGCGGVSEQRGDDYAYGFLQLVVSPPLEESGSSRIQDMLNEYCAGVYLPERRCPDCGLTGFTKKYCVVSTVPSVLIVQLKRSIYDQDAKVFFKDSTRVSFPSILTFSDDKPSFPQTFFPQTNYVLNVYPNCTELFHQPPSEGNVVFNFVDEIKSIPKSNLRYELSSVIRHHGAQMNGGHYTIDVCDDGGVNNEKRWIRYDDDRVSERTEVLSSVDIYAY